jgi:hypothetical protein
MLTVKQDYNAARETDFDKFVEKAPEKQAYRCGGAQ